MPGLVTTVLGKLIPGGPVLTTFLHTAQGLSANAQALEQLARKFFDTIELVINPNQTDPTTNKPYVVGDMTRRLLAGALPVALDLAVRQVPTFVDIRVSFQTILKSMDLRQILQKAVQKIWTPIEAKLRENPLIAKLIGRRLTPNFLVGGGSFDVWAVEARELQGTKLVSVPRFMIGVAVEGLPPKGISLVEQLQEWRGIYHDQPKVLELIGTPGTPTAPPTGLFKMVHDLERGDKKETLRNIIQLYEATKTARQQAKAINRAGKTRQQLKADDPVAQAKEKAVKAIAALAEKDSPIQPLVKKLHELMTAIGPNDPASLKLLFQQIKSPSNVSDIIRGKTDAQILQLLPKFEDYIGNNPAFAILVDKQSGEAFAFRSGFSPEKPLEEINGIKWRRGVMTRSIAKSAGGIWDPLGSHVEGQAAAFMRIAGITNAVLYINGSTPCLGEKGCFDNLKNLLAPRSQLVVINKNGKSFAPFSGK